MIGAMCSTSCTWEMVPPDTCQTSTYTFTNDIGMIFATKCAIGVCHVGSTPMAGLDFSTYAVVKTKVDDGRIQARVIDGNPGFMPNAQGGGKLSDSTIAIIQLWIDQGACE